MRMRTAGSLVRRDDALAEDLLAAYPEVLWQVITTRSELQKAPSFGAPNPALIDRLMSGATQGRIDSATYSAIGAAGREEGGVRALLSRAQGIADPQLRAEVVTALKDLFKLGPADAASLPPGLENTRVQAREIYRQDGPTLLRRLKSAPPGAERDVLYDAAAMKLVGSDPWQLLETTAALRGTLGDPSEILQPRALEADGRTSFDTRYIAEELAQDPSALQRALTFAGRDDPRRALALLPRILARFRPGDSRGGSLREMTEQVVAGWAACERTP